MNLQAAIARNRHRQARFQKYERILRRLRQRIFDYDDAGKGDKASHLIVRCQTILAPFHEARRRNLQAAKLERTPSAFEPGLNHNHG
jgi:hypothetical protein